ncbi:MAG: hypothetical protein M1838_001501 [Thelocarpon superellum]|nr:MAG: hypothetical protein M1838_001501 [Thelocarpon superellum]
MGANQSSSGGNGGPAPAGHGAEGGAKRCYYEVLDVDRQATEEEIKKAYRRKALDLHPDRNYGHVEETTRLFAEVQAAYEVLSDPQERAWYDSHRDAILRGHDAGTEDQYDHNVRVTTAEDILKMFTHFSGRIDFSDSSTGFFTGVRGTFDTLAREEQAACEWGDLESVVYPTFGHADDSYADVVRPFYAAWMSFATQKSFSWRDQYRCADAPDRRVRRMMEKENKRLRDAGIREFNEVVRSLVAFVRKRDPRYVQNAQSEADRQKTMRDVAAAQASRSRAANLAKLQEHVEPEWAKSQGPDAMEGEHASETEASEEEEFECAACGKTFKSEKQFEAHERSKKHIKIIRQLRRRMEKEDQTLNLSATGGDHDEGSDEVDGGDDVDLAPVAEEMDQMEIQDRHPTDEAKEDPTLDRDADEPPSPRKTISSDESNDEYAPREEVEQRILDATKPPSTIPDTTKDMNNDEESESNEEEITNATAATNTKATKTDTLQSDLPTTAAGAEVETKKAGKAREKRARRAARNAPGEGKGEGEGDEGKAEVHLCARCNASFPSKTKLFAHLKALNHAAPVLVLASTTAGKKKGGAKKKARGA